MDHLILLANHLLMSCSFPANFSCNNTLFRGSAQGDEEEENSHSLLRRTTIGNGGFRFIHYYMVCRVSLRCYFKSVIVHYLMAGPPESVLDWTREIDSDLSNQNNSDQVFSRKHWRLVNCQNGKF